MARGKMTGLQPRLGIVAFIAMFAFLVLGGSMFLGVLDQAQAAICPNGTIPDNPDGTINNPLGTCFISVRNHPGEFPFGITVSESESRVIVTDLFSGLQRTGNSGRAPPRDGKGRISSIPAGAGRCYRIRRCLIG